MKISIPQQSHIKYAASLDDAYKKGYFTGSMSRWELMDRVTRYNPELKWYANKTHRGLYDNNKFICGIGHNITIPKFTIMKVDPKKERYINYTNENGEFTHRERIYTGDDEGYVFARSWKIIFKTLKQRGYKIDEKDLN